MLSRDPFLAAAELRPGQSCILHRSWDNWASLREKPLSQCHCPIGRATVIDRPIFAGVISAIIFLWYKADMAITLNDTQKVEPALDEAGNTWLSYNDPSWLAKRHGANHNVEATVTALTGALNALAKAATGAQ